jgi:hypothetical protein
VPGRFTARRSTTRANHHRVVQHAREAIVADPAGAEFGDLAQLSVTHVFTSAASFLERLG